MTENLGSPVLPSNNGTDRPESQGMTPVKPEESGEGMGSTSARVCRNHAECERNKRTAFRKPQVCLTCEVREGTHFIEGDGFYSIRCDECFVSNRGCKHAAPNVCPDCYDAITLEIHELYTRTPSTSVDVRALTLQICEQVDASECAAIDNEDEIAQLIRAALPSIPVETEAGRARRRVIEALDRYLALPLPRTAAHVNEAETAMRTFVARAIKARKATLDAASRTAEKGDEPNAQ